MLSKHAQDRNRFARSGMFFGSARGAWKHVLRTVRPRRILLPAYIGFTQREGSGVLDPVEETGTPFDLYPLDKQLRADTSMLEQALSSGRYDLLLVIHYFGYQRCNLHALREACDRHGVTLVEDCAHAFQWGLPNEALGTVGDYAFYSIHKHLPTGTGGLLRQRDGAPKIPPWEAGDRADLEVVSMVACAELAGIARVRRQHADELSAGLDAISGVEPLLPGESALVPQTFPVVIANGLREQLYFSLQDAGIPTVALYYQLHSAIRPDSYPASHAVSNSILNLPVHQDLDSGDTEHLLSTLSRCAKEVGL